MDDDDSLPEWAIEAVAAGGSVLIMIVLLYFIGTSHEFEPLTQASSGGAMLIYALIFFILFMAAVGTVLARFYSGDGNAS